MRPRRRKLLLGLLFLVISGLASFAYWREWRVRSIEDVGEPFDVENFYAQYDPNEENAFDEYVKWLDVMEQIRKQDLSAGVKYDIAQDFWENADEATVAYVDEVAPLSDMWKRGSEIEHGFELDPREVTFESLLEVTQESREYARLITLETTRLMHEGRREEVWQRYRQLLKNAGHIRNGCLISQLVSFAIYNLWYEQFVRFLADEEITLEELKQYRDDLRKIHERFPDPRTGLKFEYVSMRRSLSPKLESHGWQNSLTREPEVLNRVINLYYAHWIRYYDVPPWEAPPIVNHSCPTRRFQHWIDPYSPDCNWDYFDDGSSGDQLVTAFHLPSYSQRYLNEFMPTIKNCYWANHRDQFRQKLALLQLALHIYFREQGNFPEKLEMLVPDYIDELPRSQDSTGAVLTYARTVSGATLTTADSIHVFEVYRPGTELKSLYDMQELP